MKKNIVLIFDFDGTIADTMRYITKIMNQLSKEFGFKKIGEKELEKLRGEKTKEVFKKIGIPLEKLPSVLKKLRLILTKKIKDMKPIKGVKEMLIFLKKQGYKLGILTSAPKNSVSRFLYNNGLNLFDFVYSESNIFSKGRAMAVLLKKEKLRPQQVFYVGDETRDIEAAKKSGARTVGVTWGFNNEKILIKEKPDYLIKKPKELLRIFTLL